MLRFVTLAVLAIGALTASAAVRAADGCVAPPPDAPASHLARTDHTVTGNRIGAGCGPLGGSVLDIELDGPPTWILPDPSDRGDAWFVVLADGTVDHVITIDEDGSVVRERDVSRLGAGHPPLAVAMGEDGVVVASALGTSAWFLDPLPDTRVTEVGGSSLAALAGPTERYDHGVLGDALEAGAIEVRDGSDLISRIEVGPHEVIEGIAAMTVELLPDDAGHQLLVTVSDAEVGARLRAYGLDGSVVAESESIGQGYRWLHQIGAGRLAPDGELEIIAVRTPHIGGTVEAYRLVGDRLEQVAAISGYSSHQLGSGNLDMALLADTDGDGRLEVVVPTQDMSELALLKRSLVGFEELGRLALEGELATNIAATPAGNGGLVLAVGTTDGRLRIFR